MGEYWDRVEVFRPFDACPEILIARAAARSSAFGPTDAAGGMPVIVGSAAGADEGDVARRARNELIERASNILAGRAAERASTVVTTFANLRRTATAALDPAAWQPAIAGIRDAPMLWVAGRSLVDGGDVLVPAGAAFLRHEPPPGCRVTLRAGSAGVAAHATEPLAIQHALLEILERDLIARSWYADGPVSVVDTSRQWPAPLGAALKALGLRASTLLLPGPSRSACLVTCLHTEQRAEQTFGARCLPGAGDRSAGFQRAAYEALMVRWSMGTPVAQRARDDLRRRAPVLPRNAVEHALWTFHEQDSLGRWLSKATAPAVRDEPPDRDLAAVVADHTGEDVVAVDCTMHDADAVVVRVVAPGARRLPVAAREGDLPHPFG